MKYCQLALSAASTKMRKKASENIFIGFRARAVKRGQRRETNRPAARGRPSSSNTCMNISSGFTATWRRIGCAGAYSPPQKAMFSGVIEIAVSVDAVLMDTDSAVLPRAKWVRKFEMLPAGQEETRIMPSAMLGRGC